MRKIRIAIACAMLSVGVAGGTVAAVSYSNSDNAIALKAEGEEAPAAATVSLKVYHIDEQSGEKIEDEKGKYGDAIVSKEEGEIGEEVSIIVQGNPVMDVRSQNVFLYRYLIKSVEVNGTAIQPYDSEKGEYRFLLAEGLNSVNVFFSGKTEISVIDLASMNWKSLLTVDNLLRLIALIALVFVSSGLFISIIKGKKIQAVTSAEFSEKASQVFEAKTKEFLEGPIKKLLIENGHMSQEALEAMQVLMRVSLLAQENTPESRMEIIRELQKYKTTDQDLANRIAEIVDGVIKQRDEAKQQEKETIEDLKKSLDSLDEAEDVSEESGYGSL